MDTRLAQLFLKAGASECRIAVFVGLVTLTQDFGMRGQPEVGMECGAFCTLHAVWRPGAAAFFKTDMVPRMPVPRSVYWNAIALRFFNPSIENGHNPISFVYGKSPARTEIILNIND